MPWNYNTPSVLEKIFFFEKPDTKQGTQSQNKSCGKSPWTS